MLDQIETKTTVSLHNELSLRFALPKGNRGLKILLLFEKEIILMVAFLISQSAFAGGPTYYPNSIQQPQVASTIFTGVVLPIKSSTSMRVGFMGGTIMPESETIALMDKLGCVPTSAQMPANPIYDSNSSVAGVFGIQPYYQFSMSLMYRAFYASPGAQGSLLPGGEIVSKVSNCDAEGRHPSVGFALVFLGDVTAEVVSPSGIVEPLVVVDYGYKGWEKIVINISNPAAGIWTFRALIF